MAGEFEHQSAIILGCNELVVYHPRTFQAIVRALYRRVPMIGLVSNKEQLALAKRLVQRIRLPADAVQFIVLPLDSMWVRDYGPFFVRCADGSVGIVDADYAEVDTAAGERLRDNDVPQVMASLLGLSVTHAPLRIEGGNLLSNGHGLCVSTAYVVQRNADRGYDTRQIGQAMGLHFAARRWAYLRPLHGEPTRHVDVFMTFVAPNVALVGQIDKSEDPVNAEILDEAAATLAGETTPLGPMEVHRIPMPPRRGENWRTYTNVIFANGTLLVPSYADVDPDMEQAALDLYARLLPGWEIVPIEADSLFVKRGLLHCISVNVPQFVSAEGIKQGLPIVVGDPG